MFDVFEEKYHNKNYNSNYYYYLFGDKFIYCGIHLSTNGLKENGKSKKSTSFSLSI